MVSSCLGDEAGEHSEGRFAAGACPQLIVVDDQAQDVVRQEGGADGRAVQNGEANGQDDGQGAGTTQDEEDGGDGIQEIEGQPGPTVECNAFCWFQVQPSLSVCWFNTSFWDPGWFEHSACSRQSPSQLSATKASNQWLPATCTPSPLPAPSGSCNACCQWGWVGCYLGISPREKSHTSAVAATL